MFTSFNQKNQNSQNQGTYQNIQFLQLRPSKIVKPKQEIITTTKEIVEEKPSKKMEWGEPTWFLFHTLAEKIKEEEFQNIRVELLQIIYSICSNLPCPICSTHAKQHLNGTNFNSIQTKQQLKDFLFQFHNYVNQRKNYLLFDYQNLNEKYSKAITVNIIQNFITHFRSKNHNNLMIADDFHRKRTIKEFEQWLQNHIYRFSM
jgi:hypothetical protein